MLIRDLLIKSAALLQKAGIISPMNESRIIICYVLNISLESLLLNDGKAISEDQLNQVMQIIDKRMTHYPMAYILGKKEFYGLDFIVNENVLIPRPETEEIIDLFMKYKGEVKNILDLCTGSGCIGITLASLFPDTEVDLADISEDALKIAKINAKKHNVKVNLIKSNMFDNILKVYDVIVCNPPYISELERKGLDKTIGFEPEIALFAEENGLHFYYILAKGLKNIMHTNSFAIIEAGFQQKEDVVSIFSSENYRILETKNDISGNFRNIVLMK